MNKEEFIKELQKLNIEIRDEKLSQLEKYKDFLKEYNEHTNLTTIKEDNDIYLKHFYDSLTICLANDLKDCKTLLDIGTGAGFPGMVIKIFFPHIEVTLLDSNNKKTEFLKKLSEKLEINVNVVHDRAENYARTHLNSFDIVTSRAVANLRVLSELAIPFVKKDGLFIALKGNIDENLEDAKETIEILKSKIIDKISFDLYEDKGIRTIIVINKEEITSIDKIRSYDKILKNPLKKKHT